MLLISSGVLVVLKLRIDIALITNEIRREDSYTMTWHNKRASITSERFICEEIKYKLFVFGFM